LKKFASLPGGGVIDPNKVVAMFPRGRTDQPDCKFTIGIVLEPYGNIFYTSNPISNDEFNKFITQVEIIKRSRI